MINEQLWQLVSRHLPGTKATSVSVTLSHERHDRVEAVLLMGGDTAVNGLFASPISYSRFREELNRQISWETYGLNQDSLKRAVAVIDSHDRELERLRGLPQ
jgi:hypothetical protein